MLLNGFALFNTVTQFPHNKGDWFAVRSFKIEQMRPPLEASSEAAVDLTVPGSDSGSGSRSKWSMRRMIPRVTFCAMRWSRRASIVSIGTGSTRTASIRRTRPGRRGFLHVPSDDEQDCRALRRRNQQQRAEIYDQGV